MYKAYPFKRSMVVRSLDMNKDQFRPRKEKELLGPDVPYLSAIGALMYIAPGLTLHLQ